MYSVPDIFKKACFDKISFFIQSKQTKSQCLGINDAKLGLKLVPVICYNSFQCFIDDTILGHIFSTSVVPSSNILEGNTQPWPEHSTIYCQIEFDITSTDIQVITQLEQEAKEIKNSSNTCYVSAIECSWELVHHFAC